MYVYYMAKFCKVILIMRTPSVCLLFGFFPFKNLMAGQLVAVANDMNLHP